MRKFSDEDLGHVVEHAGGAWEGLKGARIFVTGGTGFFGKWLLASFAKANRKLGLGAEMVVLSRDPKVFLRGREYLRERGIGFVKGDVRDFEFPKGEFSHVIHAAGETRARVNELAGDVEEMIVEGTRRVLAFAAGAEARRVLVTSSGAVYGAMSELMTRVPEAYLEGVAWPAATTAYGRGKQGAERLCMGKDGVEAVVARCFAFVGPGLALDEHFAVGNFIRDGLAGKTIVVKGDGTAVRSYLYAADLAVWLWTLLVKGEGGTAYNVGSEEGVTIRALAEEVGRQMGVGVDVLRGSGVGGGGKWYVPGTERARGLGLEERVGWKEGIGRTVGWEKSKD